MLIFKLLVCIFVLQTFKVYTCRKFYYYYVTVFSPLSAKAFLEMSVFRLRKIYLCNTISVDWLNVNTK